MRRHVRTTFVASLALALGLAAQAQAQLIGDDVEANVQASWNTASSGVMGQRSPGNIVGAAVAQFNELHDSAINRALQGPEITEVAPDATLDQEVRATVIEELFGQLNEWLLLLQTAVMSGSLNNGGTTDNGSTNDGSTDNGTTTVTPVPSALLGTISSPSSQ